MRLILLLLCMAATAACDRQKPAAQQGAEAGAGPVAGLDRSRKGEPFPDIGMVGPGGEPASFDEFRGEPVLVNLWATWCAPCVKELPTLNALARSEAIEVAAISQDRGPNGSVAAFLDHVGADRLEPFQDPEMALSSKLGVEVLPTSLLYDSHGREVWRFVGDRDWNAADVRPLLAEAR